MEKKYEDLLLKQGVLKLSGEIKEKTVDHIEEGLKLAQKNNCKKISLEISSVGGSLVSEGKIFDLISNFPGIITGIVKPYAYSAAANILQACHRRKALANSLLIYHDTRGSNFRLDDFYKKLNQVKQWAENFNDITTRRSKLTRSELKTLKSLDLPIIAKQALAMGLIDGIINVPKHKHHFDPKAKTSDFELKNISPAGILDLLEFFDKMRTENYPQIKIFLNPDLLYNQMVFAIYELIKSYPKHITMIGTKNLFRQTALLLLAGDRRQMYYNAKLSIPEPEIDWDWVEITDVDTPLGKEIISEQLKNADHFMRKEFVTKTKLTPASYAEMKSNEAIYDARTALKYGIIHEIINPKHLLGKK